MGRKPRNQPLPLPNLYNTSVEKLFCLRYGSLIIVTIYALRGLANVALSIEDRRFRVRVNWEVESI
jgi:hypothetical protein